MSDFLVLLGVVWMMLDEEALVSLIRVVHLFHDGFTFGFECGDFIGEQVSRDCGLSECFRVFQDKGKIPRHIRTLSKLLDTPNIKKLGRYILELKHHRENKLENAKHKLSNIHQHVTNDFLQEQEGTMSVDTHASLNLFLVEAKN